MISNDAPRIVAGFARSGTTWIQDVIAEANGLRTVFEPLHPAVMRGAQQFSNRFVAADDDNPALQEFFRRYLLEAHHAIWSDYRIRWDWLLPDFGDLGSWKKMRLIGRRWRIARDQYRQYRGQRQRSGRLTKLIRANMMLAWLEENFGAHIVFVIRHPAAVVASQMRASDVWQPEHVIARYREDKKLLDVLNNETRELLASSLSPAESMTLSWCIENRVALQQAADCGAFVVSYEELVEQGRELWPQIIRHLDLDELPGDDAIGRPSQQAWGDRLENPELVRKPAKWMDDIDSNTAAEMQRVLELTGMTMYAMDQAGPLQPLTQVATASADIEKDFAT